MLVLIAVDIATGNPVPLSSADSMGRPMYIAGNQASLGTYCGYTDSATLFANGYELGTWTGPSCGTFYVVMTRTCAPNWQCEPGQTGYEIDGCGSRRANPACAYREASLALCQWYSNVIAGQASQIAITVNHGSMTENYKLVFSGDFVGESAPFTVNAGTYQQQFVVGNLIFTTGGAKNVTASLVKV